jgi:hypothetical protein
LDSPIRLVAGFLPEGLQGKNVYPKYFQKSLKFFLKELHFFLFLSTVFSGVQGATFCPRNSSVMCTACYTKVRFMYKICLAEVEKFVKIKN